MNVPILLLTILFSVCGIGCLFFLAREGTRARIYSCHRHLLITCVDKRQSITPFVFSPSSEDRSFYLDFSHCICRSFSDKNYG